MSQCFANFVFSDTSYLGTFHSIEKVFGLEIFRHGQVPHRLDHDHPVRDVVHLLFHHIQR